MSSLAEKLTQLPPDIVARLDRFGFDRQRLRAQAEQLERGYADSGIVEGRIEPPTPGDLRTLPEFGSAEYLRLEALGDQALRARRLALVVLAGGMATRMGGVVKALVEALPGKTFLDLRLAEISAVERKHGMAPPLWLMTSAATDTQIREALGAQLDGERVAAFTQYLSLRLDPKGELFLDADGRPSEYAPGHGDLPDALRASGLLERFVARGGRSLLVTNLDNLGGTVDAAVLGFHLDHGLPVSSEVVDKLADDRGGIPVRVDGRLRALEEFRIPPSFDPGSVRVFNTNVFHIDARRLLELEMDWRFFMVKKLVHDSPVVQFERILNEITGELETAYLHLPRTGPNARFLPVKDPAELERRRPEIESVVHARGIV